MEPEKRRDAEKALAAETPWMEVLLRDAFTCQLCGGRRHLHVHHIRFRSQGGDDSTENLLTLCWRCHRLIHRGYVCLHQNSADPGALT